MYSTNQALWTSKIAQAFAVSRNPSRQRHAPAHIKLDRQIYSNNLKDLECWGAERISSVWPRTRKITKDTRVRVIIGLIKAIVIRE